jgi:hypothetical protein
VASEYFRYKEKSDALEIDETNGSMRIRCARRWKPTGPGALSAELTINLETIARPQFGPPQAVLILAW